MKKLTSIRHLMGGHLLATHGGGRMHELANVDEEDDALLQASFNISFSGGLSTSNKTSMDDSVLADLQRDEDLLALAGSGGLQFHRDHGLQFDPTKMSRRKSTDKNQQVSSSLGASESEKDEPELDLFHDKRSAVSRRNQMSRVQSRRQLTSGAVRRSASRTTPAK